MRGPTFMEFERPSGRVRPYANLYRCGDGGSRPLVLYLGGSISQAVYEERRHSPPTAIAEVFERALQARQMTSVDLVVCPCPVDTEGDGESWIADHFEESVERLGSKPRAYASVGYSAGAGYALLLGAPEARALALLGPAIHPEMVTDMKGVLEQRRLATGEPLEIGWLVNTTDPTGRVRPLHGLGSCVRIRDFSGSGGHPFADYVANGLASTAFEFVLERLTRSSSFGSITGTNG
jgi:hypothetical protein